MRKRAPIVTALVAVLLVPLPAVPASAHGEHKVAKYPLSSASAPCMNANGVN